MQKKRTDAIDGRWRIKAVGAESSPAEGNRTTLAVRWSEAGKQVEARSAEKLAFRTTPDASSRKNEIEKQIS
ncbi:hypothetical protein M1O54_01275 [Dehalococcoidia bacterium]|nr:hypothetical protein [Dehalococcoidia bacterium]